MEIFDLIDRENFDKLINECDILITHGGVGSILTGLRNDKKVIVCPRLSKYNEHVNDHQIEIVEKFSELGLILPFYENDDLNKILNHVKSFKPKKFKSNTNNIISLIEDFIDNN